MRFGKIVQEVILNILVAEGLRGDSVAKVFRRVAENAIAKGANFKLEEAGYFLREMMEEPGLALSDGDSFRIGSEILKHVLSGRTDPRFHFLASAWRISDIDSEEARLLADKIWPQ